MSAEADPNPARKTRERVLTADRSKFADDRDTLIERPKTIRDLIEQGYALEEQKKSPKKTVTDEKKDEAIEEKQEERMIGGLSL